MKINKTQKKIALIDSGSFVLPYDYHLITSLKGAGYEIDLYCSETIYNPQFIDALRLEEKVNVISLAISKTSSNRIRGILNYFFLWAKIIYKRHQYEYIILQFPTIWIVDLICLLIIRKRSAFLVHNHKPHDRKSKIYTPYMVISKAVNLLIFISDYTQEKFIETYGRKYLNKTQLIPHGLLSITPESSTKPYSKPPNNNTVIYWGNIKPYKGIEFIKELSIQKNTKQIDINIEIFGKWSQELISLKNELIDLNIKISDKFLTEQEVLSLLDKEAVFILPYKTATQSGAMYTLLNYGKYFIATDVGEIGRIFREHQLSNLLIDYNDPSSVETALKYLKENALYVQNKMQAIQESSKWKNIIKNNFSFLNRD